MAKRWYVVHTYSGYENKVKTDLEHRIEIYGLEDKVVDIQIPTEQVTELKDGGKREIKENKVFPSYVLVRMEMDDNTWAVVRNTPGVTGFVGLDGKPSPLRRDEFDKMMRRGGNRTAAAAIAPKRTASNIEAGQSIKVLSGPARSRSCSPFLVARPRSSSPPTRSASSASCSSSACSARRLLGSGA